MNKSHNEIFFKKAEKAFREIFDKAKNIDELHFAFSLSPEFRPYRINTALDAQKAFNDYYEFLSENVKSPIHARVALAFYSHIAEASGFWEVLKNMLGIIEGYKYNMIPFVDLVKNYGDKEDSIAPNANKVMRSLMKYSQKLGYTELSEVFRDAFDSDVRNGFAHADYALLDEGICFGSRYDRERIVNWVEFTHLLNRAVNFYKVFSEVHLEHLAYYETPRIVKGLLNDKEPESTWKIHYKRGESFTIEGGVGYEPGTA